MIVKILSYCLCSKHFLTTHFSNPGAKHLIRLSQKYPPHRLSLDKEKKGFISFF